MAQFQISNGTRADWRATIWTILVAVWLQPGAALAADLVTIYGRVTDAAGTPVAATCELIDPLDGKVVATQVAEPDGRFRFESLKPARYSLRFSAEHYQSLLRKDIDLTAQYSQEIVVTLPSLARVTSETVVQEEVYDNNPDELSRGGTVSHRQIASLPVPQKELSRLATLIPGVNRAPDGKIDIKGAPEPQNALLINGMSASDPATGNFGVIVPPDAIESIQVFKNPYSAQYGRFTGGLTTITTRPGGDSWHFELDDFLPDVRIFDSRVVGIRSVTPRVQFGGPLFGSRVHFSENANYSIDKQPVRGLSYPNNEIRTEGFQSFTQIDLTLSGRHFLTGTFNIFPQRISNAELSLFNPRPVTPTYHQRGYTGSFADLLSFEGNATLRSNFQLTEFDSDVHGQGSAAMTLAPLGNSGSFFNESHRVGRRYELGEIYSSRPRQFFGNHQITFGGDVSYSAFKGRSNSRQVRILREDGSLVQTVDFFGDGSATSNNTEVALFFQDQWNLRQNLTLELGGRYEAQSIASLINLAPRVGVAYRPFNNTVIRSGGGVFYDRVPLTMAGFLYQQTRRVTTYDRAGSVVAAELLRPIIAPGSASGSDGSAAEFNVIPTNTSWNLQWEQKLTSSLNLRANVLSSRTQHLFLVEKTSKPAGEFITLSGRGASRYREFEFTTHYSKLPRGEVNASYVWSHGRGDSNNYNYGFGTFAVPVIRTNLYSVLPLEIPHRFVAWGIFDLGRTVTVSPLLDLHSGSPYSALTEALDFAGAPNSRRLPTFASLDLAVSKVIPLNAKVKPKLTFKVFNLTNHFNPRDVQNHISNAQFGQFFSNQHRFFGVDLELIW